MKTPATAALSSISTATAVGSRPRRTEWEERGEGERGERERRGRGGRERRGGRRKERGKGREGREGKEEMRREGINRAYVDPD